MKKWLKKAFSLVELMVTLIVVSIITAAMAPMITKKLKSNSITVNQGGGSGGDSNGEVSTDCAGLFNEDCKLCNINFCLECEKTCTSGTYKNIPRCNCIDCETYATNCATCDSVGCLSCKTDYKLENGSCKLGVQIKEYITAGNHTFVVPDGITQIEVTLISGGAGGGGGAAVDKSATFVMSGNGNIPTLDSNNVLFTSTGSYTDVTYTSGTGKGYFTWTIPSAIKGKDVKVSACGGGGGGGYQKKGGNGGAIKDSTFPMPNQTSIKIHIGGGGGAGNSYSSTSRNGKCSLGGGGGAWTSGEYLGDAANASSCNASSSYGYGHKGGGAGAGGYDPLFSEHGTGGGAGGSSGGATGAKAGGKGSWVGGGGGGRGYTHSSSWWANGYPCGGGGGATLFFHTEYAKTAAWVAGGGGGGSSESGYGTDGSYGCGGGGGGGTGGGKGGNYNSAGSNGTGSTDSIFGSSYCTGGAAKTAGLNGAMRIMWSEGANGGSGGGAGQIVPAQTINVTSGDTLTITVGAGGTGGAKNTNGNNGGVSKIVNSAGATLISTLGTAATGGNTDGSTAGTKGDITNGRSSNTITSSSFTNTSGATTTTTTGGAGGKTIIDGSEIHCSAGGGGANATTGGSATGYGGCGGGGGGAAAAGGDGAVGYVKIKYGG